MSKKGTDLCSTLLSRCASCRWLPSTPQTLASCRTPFPDASPSRPAGGVQKCAKLSVVFLVVRSGSHPKGPSGHGCCSDVLPPFSVSNQLLESNSVSSCGNAIQWQTSSFQILLYIVHPPLLWVTNRSLFLVDLPSKINVCMSSIQGAFRTMYESTVQRSDPLQ